MPANVTIEFEKARQRFLEAKSIEEKLSALREMWKHVPKHKGAENLRAQLTRKMAKLRQELEKTKRQKTTRIVTAIKKEGDVQIVLLGFANVGKTTILNALTNANAIVAPYPFTTKEPLQGVLNFKGARIQIIDTPPIVEGASHGKASGTKIMSLARNADAVAIVVSSMNPLEEFSKIKKELENANILINVEKPKIKIEKTSLAKGIDVNNHSLIKMPIEEFYSTLKEFGITNANVLIEEPIDKEKLLIALDNSIAFKKAFVIVNEFQQRIKDEEIAKLRKEIPMLRFSSIEQLNKEEFAKFALQLLGLKLVFTKKPKAEPDLNEGVVMKKDATVEDLARKIHKEFDSRLKFARVWGSTKFPGQRVSKDYVLQNNDVVELVIS
ncbi:MAG: 50S ribosome-binding GTPase [Candidatus Diapherotrites archaeon]|nr:50S ribosome-binding GTPase [Candidatus Diapherotrites archaeon]